MEQIALKVNGLRFDALAEGPDSGKLVLFLHGFPDLAEMWLPVMSQVAADRFRAVAVNQRGYCAGARPPEVKDYQAQHLLSDVLGFADALEAEQFHLVGHDWGGLLAWQLAAEHPERIRSLSVLSTPHTNAFFDALQTDADQKQRSRYIEFFRMANGAAEAFFQAGDGENLRRVYQGKAPEERVAANARRFAEPGALTAALNWYRALDLESRIGVVRVPTLFIWGSEDLAVGETAARNTALYVRGPYWFERLDGKSHWLLDEVPEWIARQLLRQLREFPT